MHNDDIDNKWLIHNLDTDHAKPRCNSRLLSHRDQHWYWAYDPHPISKVRSDAESSESNMGAMVTQ